MLHWNYVQIVEFNESWIRNHLLDKSIVWEPDFRHEARRCVWVVHPFLSGFWARVFGLSVPSFQGRIFLWRGRSRNQADSACWWLERKFGIVLVGFCSPSHEGQRHQAKPKMYKILCTECRNRLLLFLQAAWTRYFEKEVVLIAVTVNSRLIGNLMPIVTHRVNDVQCFHSSHVSWFTPHLL